MSDPLALALALAFCFKLVHVPEQLVGLVYELALLDPVEGRDLLQLYVQCATEYDLGVFALNQRSGFRICTAAAAACLVGILLELVYAVRLYYQ